MQADIWFVLIPILGSILIVAFFSSSEAALLYVNKFRIRHLAEQGNTKARSASRVLERQERFFATILLTENAFIILASVLAERLASEVLGDGGLSILIATVVMTALIVAFGEITPKTLAAQHAVTWSLLVARPVEVIMASEKWLIAVFTLLPRVLLHLMGGSASRVPTITGGELGMLIDISEAEGVVPSGDAAVLRRVLDSGDRQVRELMTPRTQIVWIEQGTSFRDFLATYGENYYTRFPVFRGDPDSVIGIITVKDVMRAFAQGGQPGRPRNGDHPRRLFRAGDETGPGPLRRDAHPRPSACDDLRRVRQRGGPRDPQAADPGYRRPRGGRGGNSR